MSALPRVVLFGMLAAGCGTADTTDDWRVVPELEQQVWSMSATTNEDASEWLVVGGTPERGALSVGPAPDGLTSVSVPEVPLLNWGQLFANGRGVAVGREGVVLTRQRENGDWRLQQTPTQEDLWGVWGARPDDLWAVGGRGQAEGQAVLLHYDGARWLEVTLPELERPRVWALYKVWGTAADDVWVVGQRGLLLHYDGAEWSEHGAGTGEDLIALWGTAPDRIVAVGGRSSAVVARYDGKRWSSESLAPLPGLNGVWTGDGQTVFVGGIEGTLADLDFDSLVYVEKYQHTPHVFHAVHGGAGQVLGVGGSLDMPSGPFVGLGRLRRIGEAQ